MKIRLAVLLYGIVTDDNEKKEYHEIMTKLQGQLNSMPKDETEVVFYTDAGEMSIEEKKSWLIGQTTSNSYVFVTKETELPDNFMLFRLNAIKNGKSTQELIKLGVFRKDLN